MSGMAECISCGLLLGAGVNQCPGCGAEQTLAAASAADARCAVHPDAAAKKACARCGRFMCVACVDSDSRLDSCRECGPALAAELEARIEALSKKANLTAMTQAVVSIAIAALTGDHALQAWMVGLGLPTVAFAAWGLHTRRLSVASLSPGWVMALLALWGSAAAPAMLVGVGLAVLGARWVWQVGPLERDVWALRRRHMRRAQE